ncbi:MAG: homoserine dehydrogenase [Acidobacteria bacterium]|nr:homoserine dehydrogenase [Acidobacteriota bacterium]MDW7983417.1 homoserine dehydrogenase [Acidobacteriota bacterium]
MNELRIALIGLGAVGRAWVRLLMERADRIQGLYGTRLIVTGVFTARHGAAIDPKGLDLPGVLRAYEAGDLTGLGIQPIPTDGRAFVEVCPADVLVELSVLNPQTGQPALDYVRQALQRGLHVVTANKGPIALAYRELRALARAQNRWLLFEASVMDGIPIFSMVRWGLPAAEIRGFYGILNSTTNLVLTLMEQGTSMEEAIRQAQAIGIAEADPSHDIDGWDAAVKVCILANVWMDANLRPTDVDRTGIRGVSPRDLRAALERGHRVKLVCRAQRQLDGTLQASVRPEEVPLSDPLAQTKETEAFLCIESDSIAPLALVERARATPVHTAYGVLADVLQIARLPHPVV